MAFTVAQVSDTHLGARTQLFRTNFDRVVQAIEDLHPDLVVATGDQTLDGADQDADMALAAAQFARLAPPVHFVPGNHDVGDHPERAPRQPVNDDRLERFRRAMGRDRWVVDHGDWRLLGLDSQIMGAHPAETSQARLIEDALATLGHRRIAVFIHKPFFAADPDETLFDYWSVPPFARAPLRPLLDHPNLRLVASGHLHLHHETTRGPARFVWAPSAAFVVGPQDQPGLPGERPTGLLLHSFDDDAVHTRLVVPPGMERPFHHDIRDQTYPAA